MTGLLTPAQQTTVLLLLALFLLILTAAWLARSVRRARGAAAMRRVLTAQAGPASTAQQKPPELPGPWRALRDEVEMTNRVLTPSVYERARRIFLDYYAAGKPGGSALSPAGLTREYDAREEFLLVVDEHGRPAFLSSGILKSFHKTSAAHPAFKRWFREELLQEGQFAGTPVLLTARWLCHLIGLRHSTVEIFIDPPDLEGYTLVQVRGMDKFEAPGAFDIPCAGHVDGVDADEASLRKELREELNLTLEQLDELRLIERYNSYSEEAAASSEISGSEHGGGWQRGLKINNEHRILYRARLKESAAASIRFSDGEVAGLAVFALPELRALVKAYPERVASGLSDALGFYDSPGIAHRQ